MEHREKQDLIILGGGLAGLSLALQVQQAVPGAKITILEKRAHPVPESAFKVGESTVEVAAHYFGVMLGLREHIQKNQLPKFGLRFFFPSQDNTKIENRLELGDKRYAPCPSYQLDRGRFENYLSDLCRRRNIQFMDHAEIQEINLGKMRSPHRVTYERNQKTESIESRWVVDASGRRAFLKRQLGLAKKSPHEGNAVWFRLKKKIKVDDWSQDSGWQEGHQGKTARWYSTNHLMGEGYWVWLIPLASGSTSIGIVAAEAHHALSDINSEEKALRWLETHEPQCAKVVKENLHTLQDFCAIKQYSVECKQVFSARRWGITGEAGFFHDPFYSPGSDFIAFSNTFLTDLIRRDLTGKDFRIRAYSYDRIFKRFFYGTATVYRDKYSLFGNPTVMPVKILWDYLIYWSITSFIFLQGRMCHQTMYLRNISRLRRLTKANHFMQDFFMKWHHVTKDVPARGLINISGVSVIREKNRQLLDDLSSQDFFQRFDANVTQLETIGYEIVEQSGLRIDNPFQPCTIPGIRSDAFQQVFHPVPHTSYVNMERAESCQI